MPFFLGFVNEKCAQNLRHLANLLRQAGNWWLCRMSRTVDADSTAFSQLPYAVLVKDSPF
jgi:hypothetical protein